MNNLFILSRTLALHRHLVIDALTDEDIEVIFLSEEIMIFLMILGKDFDADTHFYFIVEVMFCEITKCGIGCFCVL